MNLQIRTLEDSLIAQINASPVAIEAKRLIVQNILNLIKDEADKAIINELNEGKEEEHAEST